MPIETESKRHTAGVEELADFLPCLVQRRAEGSSSIFLAVSYQTNPQKIKLMMLLPHSTDVADWPIGTTLGVNSSDFNTDSYKLYDGDVILRNAK